MGCLMGTWTTDVPSKGSVVLEARLQVFKKNSVLDVQNVLSLESLLLFFTLFFPLFARLV